MEDGAGPLPAIQMGDLMTKKDATWFLMGFIMGALLNEKLSMKYSRDGELLRKVSRKGLKILLEKEAGFFNALEPIVREEIEKSSFVGDYN